MKRCSLFVCVLKSNKWTLNKVNKGVKHCSDCAGEALEEFGEF